MDFPVRREVGLRGEVPSAHLAGVLLLPGVDVLRVRLQAAEVAELLGAEGALEGLPRTACCR